MGVGHVPPSQVFAERPRVEFPRRQHRGNRTKRPDVAQLTHEPHRLGSVGEQLAAEFLERRGATIAERNLSIGRGELDLVIAAPQRVAVEVKSGSGAFDPVVHFDDAKQGQVRALARAASCRRVDLVTVWFRADGVWIRWLKAV